MNTIKKRATRQRRQWHIRKKVQGTAEIPRMAIFKSTKHIYVQFIDDDNSKTLASASSLDKSITKSQSNVDGASEVGKLAAENAKKAGIEKIVFDRGGFKYHGRVKSLADAARENGLKF